MPKLSTSIKWILASLLIEGVMLCMLITNNLNHLSETLHEQTNQRLTELTVALQSAISAPLIQMDYATVEAIMTETVALNGINYLVMTDVHQQPIVRVGWPKDQPLPAQEASAFTAEALKDARFDTRVTLNLYGNPLGTLLLGLSTQFYVDAYHQALVRSIVIAIIELALSALLLVGISRWLSRKFHQVAIQATAIAEGRFEQRLEHAHDRDFDALTRAFNTMAETIEARITALNQANQAKSEFMSRISHELRTPLNAILGFAQMLDLERISQAQRDQVHHIHNAGVHLLSLINQILEVNEQSNHALQSTLHTLPTNEPISAPAVPTPVGFGHLKVLLVEDNVINQMVATKLLQKLDITPDIANNGQEALDALQQATYDLVLLDVQMPVMDGYQTITNIRQAEITSKAHQLVIGLSANALDTDKEKAIRLGMDGYLTKPIDFNALQKTLSERFPA